MKQRHGVVEFVERVGLLPRDDPLENRINKWLVEFEKEADPGYYLYIQDVKYHTQYRKADRENQSDMIHSALIIWQWRKEGETY